jgi:hypothetical protein
MVLGLEGFVGRLFCKSQYFSFPFSSIILIVNGNNCLNAFAELLSKSVAVKVLALTVILILDGAISLLFSMRPLPLNDVPIINIEAK